MVRKLSGKTRRMYLGKCYIFKGERYGPGEDVEVPEEFGFGYPELLGSGVKPEDIDPATDEEEAGTDLPEDFPHLAQLLENGIDTVEGAKALVGYTELTDIGEKRWDEIQAALALM